MATGTVQFPVNTTTYRTVFYRESTDSVTTVSKTATTGLTLNLADAAFAPMYEGETAPTTIPTHFRSVEVYEEDDTAAITDYTVTSIASDVKVILGTKDSTTGLYPDAQLINYGTARQFMIVYLCEANA